MKKFIIKLGILIVLPVLLSAVAMELLLRNIPNDYANKTDYLEAHAEDVNILIAGDCHSLSDFDGAYFSDKIFNLANSAQPLIVDNAFINKYKADLKNWKVLIIPVAYASLWTDLENMADPWRQKNYFIYNHLALDIPCKYRFEISSLSFKTNLTRIYSSYIQKENTIQCDSFGSMIYNSIFSKDLNETGALAVKIHTLNNLHSSENEKKHNECLSTLHSIIQVCKERGVKVILYTPPTYKTYHSLMNKEQIDMVISTAKEFVGTYDNCVYYDLTDDKLFVKEDFYDGHHLNDIGAKKLSLLLNQYIEEK
jgi:hypothetical protein